MVNANGAPRRPSFPSPYRRRVLQSALGPQRVEAALDLDRRTHADVALEALAVVPHRLNDAVGPIVGQAEPAAEITLDAEQTADRRVVGLQHLIDVGLRHAELFG